MDTLPQYNCNRAADAPDMQAKRTPAELQETERNIMHALEKHDIDARVEGEYQYGYGRVIEIVIPEHHALRLIEALNRAEIVGTCRTWGPGQRAGEGDRI